MDNHWLGWFAPWWPDLAAFFRMGRHGVYVWASVALTAAALAAEWLLLRQRRAKLHARHADNLEHDQ